MVPVESRSFSLDLKTCTEAAGRHNGELLQSRCRISTPDGEITITGNGTFILNVLTDLLSSNHGYSREEIIQACGQSDISGEQIGLALHGLLSGSPYHFSGHSPESLEEQIDNDSDSSLPDRLSIHGQRRRGRPRKAG